MTQQRIQPHTVTKPIQLLAAWLVGLILVDSAFLAAAATISTPDWVSGALVMAAIANVPIFVASIFLLQTRFRPEMQEDTFYSKYLETKTGAARPEPTSEAVDALRRELIDANRAIAELVAGVQTSLRDMSVAASKYDPSHGGTDLIANLNAVQARLSSIREEVDQEGKSKWAQRKISVNKALPQYPKIVTLLSKQGIPVHEVFGSLGHPPNTFTISFGPGFSLEEARDIIGALSPLKDGVISFADYDQTPGEYDNTVLIGSYGNDSGLPLQAADSILGTAGMSTDQFYRLITVHENDL